MSELTQEYLKECLNYNKETGVFTWKVRPLSHFKTLRACNGSNTKFSGKTAGSDNGSGYISIEINGRGYKAHRLAWLYVYGYSSKNGIDHIDTIKHNNFIKNLRDATDGENKQNQIIAQSNNKSTGILGVYKVTNSKTFKSIITINKERKSLGHFKTAKEAHQAYLTAKRELHPFGML